MCVPFSFCGSCFCFSASWLFIFSTATCPDFAILIVVTDLLSTFWLRSREGRVRELAISKWAINNYLSNCL